MEHIEATERMGWGFPSMGDPKHMVGFCYGKSHLGMNDLVGGSPMTQETFIYWFNRYQYLIYMNIPIGIDISIDMNIPRDINMPYSHSCIESSFVVGPMPSMSCLPPDSDAWGW